MPTIRGRKRKCRNYEWDAMFDELTALEQETGYILPDSPTQNTGAEETGGNREPHEIPCAFPCEDQAGLRVEKVGRRAGYLAVMEAGWPDTGSYL